MTNEQLRKAFEYQLILNIPYFKELTPNGKLGVGKAIDQAMQYVQNTRKYLQLQEGRLCVA